MDNGKVSPRTAKVLPHIIVLSLHSLNDRRCEGIRTQHEQGETGQDACNGACLWARRGDKWHQGW